MQAMQDEVSLRRMMIAGAVALLRPPFRTLLFVEILITLVASSIPPGATDAAAILGAIVLLVVSAVLQIAILLAAAEPEPGRIADPWIFGVFKRRCFWRFAFTRLLVRLMVVVGLAVVLIAGARLPLLWAELIAAVTGLLWGFVVGSIVGVAEQAAVLEHRWPFNAMGRSSELTRPARRPIGILFALFVVAPNFLSDRFLGLDLVKSLGALRSIPAVLAVIVSTAGLIALTRAYVELGGSQVAGRPR
jgi:hypothetical protein